MRRLLRHLPVRIGPFRSTTVLAAAAAVIVAAVVIVARVVGGDTGPGRGDRPPAVAAASAGASGSPSVATDGDDGESLNQPVDASPSVAPGRAGPTSVAAAFAAAWVRRTLPADRWLAGLRPWTTPAALASLNRADPNGVPAERVTGAAQVVLSDVGWAQCRVPLDFGDLQLRLVGQPDGRWLVDGIAWTRS